MLGAGIALLAGLAAAGDAPPDPMRPPLPRNAAASGARPAVPVLTAVRRQGEERIAVFGGKLVHAGDVAGGYRILAILEDGIRYMHDGQVSEQRLPHPTDDIKKPAAVAARAVPGDQVP